METQFITVKISEWRKAIKNEMILDCIRREIEASEYSVITIEELKKILELSRETENENPAADDDF